MKRAAIWLALLLSALAMAASAWVSATVYERMPHLEDEFAYVWQAQVFAAGKLTLPTPQFADSFLVPFVVDFNGRRFSKYPPGWQAALAVGEFFGGRDWVNPFLAGVCVWLTFRLGQKLRDEITGLLAALLTVTSPFFLLNSGSLLSHVWGLTLTLTFFLGWLDAFGNTGENHQPPRLPLTVAGFALGMLALTRPLTAVGVAIPFVLHSAVLWWRGNWKVRRALLVFALLTGAIAGLLLVWQWVVTGNPLTNSYTLWWEYDKVGFGAGYGVTQSGHTPRIGWINTRFSLSVGYGDLFGWGRVSWLFLPFGVWALRRSQRAWLVLGVFPVLVGLYLAYWVGAWLFGPRYYFEALPALTIASAAGVVWLAGWGGAAGRWLRVRRLGMTALLSLLLWLNLWFYLPPRLQMMHNLYGIGSFRLAPFETEMAQAMTPALVIVETERWMPYSALTTLQSPFLDSPFIFAISIGPRTDAALIRAYSGKRVILWYDPQQPDELIGVP